MLWELQEGSSILPGMVREGVTEEYIFQLSALRIGNRFVRERGKTKAGWPAVR